MSNSVPITFREIERFDDPCLTAYLDLYETAFPAEQRIPVSNFVEVLLAKQEDAGEDYHLLAATLTLPTESTEQLIGMARVDVDRECDAAYLVYIAVVSRLRGAGCGSRFMEKILQILHNSAPVSALVIEVDDPENQTGEGRAVAEKRVEFYRKQGAKYLDGIRYMQSVDFYPDGVPMKLAFIPFREITPEQAFATAECLFGDSVTRTGFLTLS